MSLSGHGGATQTPTQSLIASPNTLNEPALRAALSRAMTAALPPDFPTPSTPPMAAPPGGDASEADATRQPSVWDRLRQHSPTAGTMAGLGGENAQRAMEAATAGRPAVAEAPSARGQGLGAGQLISILQQNPDSLPKLLQLLGRGG